MFGNSRQIYLRERVKNNKSKYQRIIRRLVSMCKPKMTNMMNDNVMRAYEELTTGH
jgi:hypothetical protein